VFVTETNQTMMEVTMAEYDPQIIQKFADRLYRRARTVTVITTILFILIGGSAGLVANVPFGGDEPSIIGASVGAVFLGAIGFVLGREGAFRLKLQAQTALCQIKIEENTRRQSTLEKAAPISPE
jgi:hypothetical protein